MDFEVQQLLGLPNSFGSFQMWFTILVMKIVVFFCDQNVLRKTIKNNLYSFERCMANVLSCAKKISSF